VENTAHVELSTWQPTLSQEFTHVTKFRGLLQCSTKFAIARSSTNSQSICPLIYTLQPAAVSSIAAFTSHISSPDFISILLQIFIFFPHFSVRSTFSTFRSHSSEHQSTSAICASIWKQLRSEDDATYAHNHITHKHIHKISHLYIFFVACHLKSRILWIKGASIATQRLANTRYNMYTRCCSICASCSVNLIVYDVITLIVLDEVFKM
jgi:hypothetical protein